MTTHADRAAAWIYSGIWALLVDWFRVPREPPALPAAYGERVESFQPAPAFLTYLKFWFWLALLPSDAAFTIGYVVVATTLVAVGLWWIALLLLPAALLLIVGPDIPVFVGLHLRYDTTWYVMSGRSLRIRSGIWVLQETTITFENVQNVSVTQNPLQRYYGIANVLVDTAGGSADAKTHKGSGHRGVIEGVTTEDAARLREMILAKVRGSATAGLGDEDHHRLPGVLSEPGVWSAEHLAVLREIRDDLAALHAVR